MQKKNDFRNAKGLTLIEVLIALAIISIALTAIIKATSQAIRGTTHIQNKMVSTWVGEEVMNEIRAAALRLNNNELTGEMNQLDRTWYWLAELESTPNKRIKKVMVSVYAQDADREEKKVPIIQLESYLYDEKSSENGS